MCFLFHFQEQLEGIKEPDLMSETVETARFLNGATQRNQDRL